MLQNRRFLGAWELISDERRAADGSTELPWGPEPFGMIIYDETGHFSAQLGSRGRAGEHAGYLAYAGTIEAADVAEGTLVHHVLGASADGLRPDQTRTFRFDGPDELELCTPPNADGASLTLRWRRYR